MEVWTSHSRPLLQRFLSATMAAVGGLMLWLHHRSGAEPAALWLGLLLTGLGIAGILSAGRQTVTVDPRTATITVTTEHLTGSSERRIDFSDVDSIRIQRVGRASSATQFFSLELRLRTGDAFALFTPGRFYAGSMSRATVEGWRTRLAQMVRPGDPSGAC